MIGCKLGSCPIYLHVKNNNIDWSRPPVESLAPPADKNLQRVVCRPDTPGTCEMYQKITHLGICSSVKPADPTVDQLFAH